MTLLKFTRRIGIILFDPLSLSLSLSKYECQRFNVSKSVNTLVTSLKGLKWSLACCWTWKICLSYRKEGRPGSSLLLLNTKWAKGHNEGRVSRDSSSSFEDCPHEKQHGLVRKKGQTALILACHIIGKRKRRRTPKAQNCCWVIHFFCPCKKNFHMILLLLGD